MLVIFEKQTIISWMRTRVLRAWLKGTIIGTLATRVYLGADEWWQALAIAIVLMVVVSIVTFDGGLSFPPNKPTSVPESDGLDRLDDPQSELG